jgi:sigma-B regulation protein RsbU (phosphoserine phosphatase)
MTHRGPDRRGHRTVMRTLKEDARKAWADARESSWARSLGRTFEDLQAFYLTQDQRDSLRGMGAVRRALHLVWWLFQALFFKLTPPRRVVLVIALVLFVTAGISVSIGEDARARLDVPILGAALLLVLLMLELRDKLLARNELEAGRAVQIALMPDDSPAIAGWDVWLFTRPANDVGGDLVDYLALDPDRYGISLADVAGKALPAALLMAKVQATLRALGTEFTSLSELGVHVNRILCRDGLPDRFVTLVYMEVARHVGRVRLLNAGHPPPVVLRGGRAVELPRGDMAMGLLPSATFAEQSADLQPGDMLVVYSDGVTEAMNEHGAFFGDDRFLALLPALAGLPPADAGARILGEVAQFVGDAKPHDDLSLVILKRTD